MSEIEVKVTYSLQGNTISKFGLKTSENGPGNLSKFQKTR